MKFRITTKKYVLDSSIPTKLLLRALIHGLNAPLNPRCSRCAQNSLNVHKSSENNRMPKHGNFSKSQTALAGK